MEAQRGQGTVDSWNELLFKQYSLPFLPKHKRDSQWLEGVHQGAESFW